MTELATAARSLVVEREMPHPPEKVWRALTQNPLLETWLMKNDFRPIVGHRFNFRAEPMPHWNGVVDCEVLVVEPCERLSLECIRRGGGGRAEDRRHLDIDTGEGRHARAHGTVRLPPRGRACLPGRGLRLAAVRCGA